MQPSLETSLICSKEDFFKMDKIVMSLIISATLYLTLALQNKDCVIFKSCFIFISVILSRLFLSVTYIRVTGNSKEIPILNSNCSVVRLTQVNEGESISFIYMICLYHGFAIHSVISLLLTKTFNTFTNTEIV